MKILLNGINYHPEEISTGKFTTELSEWLVSRGHDVRVVTSNPYYPGWQVYAGFRNRWTVEVRTVGDGKTKYTIFRSPLWVPEFPRGWSRILHLFSFAFSCIPQMLWQINWRPDIVWVVSPTFLNSPIAWFTARCSGAKAWLHVQDFELDVALGVGVVREGIASRIARISERWMFRRFDRVSTISHRMVDRLLAKGVDEDKVYFFPNWVDVELIKPVPPLSGISNSLHENKDVVIALYAGNMGEKQGLELLIEAARKLRIWNSEGTSGGSCTETRHKETRFVFCGDGAARQRLEKQSAGLSNVHWLPVQPVEVLNDLLNSADIHLVPQKSGVADLALPSKLTGIMASGHASVVMADEGTTLHEVVTGRGVVVPPGNVDKFAEAVDALAQDPEHRFRLGRAARAYAEKHFDKNKILSDFEREAIGLVSQRQLRSKQKSGSFHRS